MGNNNSANHEDKSKRNSNDSSQNGTDWLQITGGVIGAVAAAAAGYAAYEACKQKDEKKVPITAYADLGIKSSEKQERCYGRFKCPDCCSEWSSGYTWPNYGQKCKKCRKYFVLPYDMEPLDKNKKSQVEKPHLKELCEKCEELGHVCLSS